MKADDKKGGQNQSMPRVEAEKRREQLEWNHIHPRLSKMTKGQRNRFFLRRGE